MTIQLFRFSGAPVSAQDIEAHAIEFKAKYLEIEKRLHPDMLAIQGEVQAMENELAAKYDLTIEVPFPKSQKQWRELSEKYEAPLLVARSSENPKQLVLVIMDNPIG
jgi:hypothetical protein